jgi:hypothetical protein
LTLSKQGFTVSEQAFALYLSSVTLYERGCALSEEPLTLYLSSFALYEEGLTVYERPVRLSEAVSQGFFSLISINDLLILVRNIDK